MNNYLTSIAARILVAAPAVRPRLVGQFEPSLSIENVDSLPRNATKTSDVEEKRERIAIEAEGPRDFRSSAEKSPEIAPPLDHQTRHAPEVKSEETAVPMVSDVTASHAPIIRETVQPIVVESSRQSAPVETRPVDNEVGVTSNSEFRNQPAAKSQKEISFKQHLAEPVSPSIEFRPPEPKRIDLTNTSAVQPLISNDTQTTVPPSRSEPRKTPSELETIVIREQTVPAQATLSLPVAKPQATPALPDRNENVDGKTPAVVHSRITPLIERLPEPVQNNRSTSQPQPTIQVTIGRVEVRAVQSTAAQTKPRAPAPVMNLDDYLKRRSQGNSR